MSAHTPGPWIAKNGAPTFIPLRAHHCEKLGFSIGFVSWEKDDGRGLPIANARLIAAAPELLEALQDVLSRIEKSEEWWMDCPDRGGFDAEVIRAAIAKANGGNHA